MKRIILALVLALSGTVFAQNAPDQPTKAQPTSRERRVAEPPPTTEGTTPNTDPNNRRPGSTAPIDQPRKGKPVDTTKPVLPPEIDRTPAGRDRNRTDESPHQLPTPNRPVEGGGGVSP
jgi:hypothetical protein